MKIEEYIILKKNLEILFFHMETRYFLLNKANFLIQSDNFYLTTFRLKTFFKSNLHTDGILEIVPVFNPIFGT